MHCEELVARPCVPCVPGPEPWIRPAQDWCLLAVSCAYRYACMCVHMLFRSLSRCNHPQAADASSSSLWCAFGARLLDPQPTASGHHGPVLITVEPTLVSHQVQHACCSASEKARADSLVEDSASRGPAPGQTHFVLCPGLHGRRSGQDSMGMPRPGAF